ncbi:hypothetical protein BCL57_001926 [Agromyces flavus]|uniref:DUF6993 domain-containing protein n=1 Tax=Agromyces flavus TaxID=589382 RepID=A0A1H1QBM0_9MICO|nr:hypothetical protein [Agromyces flavus]MCP2367767.1 hypothetical protein [Agromyces flavus]GGI47226.1 hypothetical protein GCM10010932_19140 [Agromyces flavus]SDS20892.1 hypothetical protein SAMN04489721_0942 [Agromyces flavus]
MRRRAVGAATITVVSVLVFAACTPRDAVMPPAPSTSGPEATPSVGATVPPASEPPALRPQGSATDNLPYFDAINRAAIAADAGAGGRDFVDALIAAGFEKSAMQVTADATTIGDPADSIQFSVRFAGECLVGQYGPKSDGYHSAVRPALGTGDCLIGQTRPIDW